MAYRGTAKTRGRIVFYGISSIAILIAFTACIPNYDDLVYGRAQCSGRGCGNVANSGGSTGQAGSSMLTTGGNAAGGKPSAIGGSFTGGNAAGGKPGGIGGSPTGGQGGRTSQTTSATGGSHSYDDTSCAGSAATTDSGTQVVRLFGTATADSEENNGPGKVHPASLAIDCDTTTRWTAANEAVGHFWTLDLGVIHALSRIEIMWEYPPQALKGLYDYTVGVSDSNATYSLAIDKSANEETIQTQGVDFPSGTSGRYVRLTVVGLPAQTSLGTTWAGVYEIRVFGQ
jgi:hypothetical protein